MSKVFPKLDELYIAIINDCYIFFLENSKKNISEKELIKKKEEQIDVIDAIKILNSSMQNYQPKNDKFFDILSFTSYYIYSIYEFFSSEKIDNIEVKYFHEYCLAYIALVGYENFFINSGDDELFSFQCEKHKFFYKLLNDYSVLTEMKKYYESNANQIKEKFSSDKNLYLNLVIKFDADSRFYPLLIQEKQDEYLKETKKENKKIDQKKKK